MFTYFIGEIRIQSGLKVFVRTASRYDDSRIISLPDLKLRINLGCFKNSLLRYFSIQNGFAVGILMTTTLSSYAHHINSLIILQIMIHIAPFVQDVWI